MSSKNDTQAKSGSKEKKVEPKLFIPSESELNSIEAELAGREIGDEELPTVLMEYANRAYLACMLDEGRVHVSRSKKTGKPLSAKLIFEKSDPNIKRVFAFIMHNFGVKGKISTKDYRNTPTHKRAVEAGVSRGREKPTHLLTISDPSHVRKLCEKALPFSERQKLLREAIEASDHQLGEAST